MIVNNLNKSINCFFTEGTFKEGTFTEDNFKEAVIRPTHQTDKF